MTRLAKPFATVALITMLGAAAADHGAMAADQRYVIEACGGAKPCVFVLNTETGEIRYCDTAGCRALDAVEPAERPSPFPLAGQGPITGQTVQGLPLGKIEGAAPSVLDQLDSPPASGGEPSPFPYVEPAPRRQ